MTECSSVVLEASRFNVPSIVTSAYGLELYSNNMMVHYSSMDYGIVSVIQDVAVTINYKENHSNIIDRKDDEKFMSELWNIMR